jgi:hypothetical protein
MATLTRDGDTITVRLTTAEKLLSVRRDVHLSASSVRTVDVIDDPIKSVRGLRPRNFKILGGFLPGMFAVGTFFDGAPHRRLFAAVHASQPRGLRIHLADGAAYTQVIISLDDPDSARILLQ